MNENDEEMYPIISVIPKNNFHAGAKVTWLTDYEEGGDYSASNPYIVRIDGDTLWIAWEEMQGHNERVS